MSYTFLLEQAEVSSAECFSDIPACVLLKSNRTAETFCCNDSATESCRGSLSGMTCVHSTEHRGEEESISSAEGSHAKTSAQPAKVQESQDNEADFGEKWLGLYVKFDPDTCSWKTHRDLYPWDLEWSLLTLPSWGLMRHGELFQLVTSAHRMSVSAFGLLHATPTKVMPVESESPEDRIHLLKSGIPRKRSKQGISGSVNWAQLMLLLGYLPTPTLCEYYMGWPIGWTDLKPLETDKFRQWQHSHGEL